MLAFFMFGVLIQNLPFQGIILLWTAYCYPVAAFFSGSLVWDFLFVSLLFGNAVLEGDFPDKRGSLLGVCRVLEQHTRAQ